MSLGFRARSLRAAILLIWTVGVAPGLAAAEEEAGPQEPAGTEERLDAVERAVDVLTREQDRLRTIIAVPEDGELKSFGGMAPAASKIYFKERGLSIGGYGEWRGRFLTNDNPDNEPNELDALRLVLYTGYKFNDWIVFNSELEFEHGGEEVALEFMTLDFLFHEAANVRAGLVLIPMGFINEIHEPVFYYSASRPEVDRRIIPTTWRENGGGLYGEAFDRVSYRAYVVNGFDASGFDVGGLRDGRQNGSEALAEDFAFVGRVDVRLFDGVVLGGSVYTGKSGQNKRITDDTTGITNTVPDAWTTIWELHAEIKRAGFTGRALWAQSYIDQTGSLNRVLENGTREAVARRMVGGYGEVAYEVLQWICPDSEMTLEPFYRFEMIDTQDRVNNAYRRNDEYERHLHVVGLQFKPHPQVVLKADWRYIDSDGSEEIPNEFEIGFGFVF